MINLCVESLKALYNYWICERNHARDCRWTQNQHMKKQPNNLQSLEMYEMYDDRYKSCDKHVRAIRKHGKELVEDNENNIKAS